MLIEEQIHARQERAKEAIKRILSRPKGKPFGDYHLLSTSGQEYRVAMRGPGLFDNYCSCPDFSRNTLGTCKHIESILDANKRSLLQLERKRTSERGHRCPAIRARALMVELRNPGPSLKSARPSTPTVRESSRGNRPIGLFWESCDEPTALPWCTATSSTM